MKRLICSIIIILLSIITTNSFLFSTELSWDASPGDVTGYRIYYGTIEGDYPSSIEVGNSLLYSLDNLNLPMGTTYYFIVRSYNEQGESPDSNVTIYNIEAGDTTPPLPPQGVSAVVNNGKVELKWTKNDEVDISGYRVYYGTSIRNYGLPIPVDGTEYSIPGLKPDMLYYFAVTAVDTSGNESGYSFPEIMKTIPGVVEDPRLTWDAPTGDVSGYIIYYGMLEGNYTENVDVGNVTQYALDNFSLTEGVMYYFVIRAYNASEESDDSNVATYIIGEPVDTQAPVVTITGPTLGTTYGTQSGSINLSGTSSDNTRISSVTWTNSRSGSGTATGTDNWSAAGIILSEGDNVITISARDTAGNTSTDVLTITYTRPDTTAPVVAITSPTSGTSYGTETSQVNIAGTASDAKGITQVSWSNSRGGSGTASGTDSWAVSGIGLAEGENLITITARDEAGNASTDTVTIMYAISDTTAPIVTISSPTSASIYGVKTSRLNIAGTASDAEGIIQISWSNSRGGSGAAIGTNSWSVAGISLAEGKNLITITARDEAGNASTDTLTIVYTIVYTILDTKAPVVTITGPTSGTSYGTQSDSINLSGTSSDKTGISSITWSNSRSGSGTAIGADNWSAAGITLSEGDNVITITARDKAGNASTDTLTIMYTKSDTKSDTTAPVVTITSPTSATIYGVKTSKLNIAGAASDAEGITQVSWSNSRGGSGTATGTSNWSAAGISLSEGKNLITITARDEAGNTSIDTLTIMYTILDTILDITAPVVTDTQPPVLTLIMPTTQRFSFTRKATMTFSGTALDNIGVKMVKWVNAQGGSGVANGTSNWEAVDVPLARWWNNITITAEDEAGNKIAYNLTVFSWR